MGHLHLISTKAAESTCPRCRRPTLTAIAEGLDTRVDTQALDRAGELRALLANRWTYTLTPTRELVHRDASRIGNPMLRGTIHAQHACQPTPKQGELF